MKKQILSICVQVACFTLCFVMCAMFLLHTSSNDIVPQDATAVNKDVSKKTVIIDPGHGGEDSGAVGIDGTLEKELNLALAEPLSNLLTCSGFEVIETRTEDVMLGNGTAGHKKMEDLKSRVEIGNSNPDAYYISIHMNKFPKEYCKGIQLFYSPNNPGSIAMAGTLQTLIKNYLQEDNNREIKNGSQSIYLMDRVQNPAILVECGFVSNTDELTLLKSTDYQKKIALLIAATVNEARQSDLAA